MKTAVCFTSDAVGCDDVVRRTTEVIGESEVHACWKADFRFWPYLRRTQRGGVRGAVLPALRSLLAPWVALRVPRDDRRRLLHRLAIQSGEAG